MSAVSRYFAPVMPTASLCMFVIVCDFTVNCGSLSSYVALLKNSVFVGSTLNSRHFSAAENQKKQQQSLIQSDSAVIPNTAALSRSDRGEQVRQVWQKSRL